MRTPVLDPAQNGFTPPWYRWIQRLGTTLTDITNTEAAAWPTILDYGGVNDAQRVYTGAISSGGTALTASGAGFTLNDIGKGISVEGAGAAGAVLVTTIEGFTSSSQVTLADQASTTVIDKYVSWGTDNDAALTAMLAATNGAGCMLPAGGGGYWYKTGISIGLPTTGTGFRLWGNHMGDTCSILEYGGSGTAVQTLDSRYVILERIRVNAWNAAIGVEIKATADPQYSYFNELVSVHVRGAQTPKAGSTGIKFTIGTISASGPANYFHKVQNCDVYGWHTGVNLGQKCNGNYLLNTVISNVSKYGVKIACDESVIDGVYFNSSNGVSSGDPIQCLYFQSTAIDNRVMAAMVDPGTNVQAYYVENGAVRNQIDIGSDQSDVASVVLGPQGYNPYHQWNAESTYGVSQNSLGGHRLYSPTRSILGIYDMPAESYWGSLDSDMITLTDGAMTSGSAAFTAASAAFTRADVGKVMTVRGAGASGANLTTTISAWTSGTAVTLGTSASTTVTNALSTYGHGRLSLFAGRQGSVADMRFTGAGAWWEKSELRDKNGIFHGSVVCPIGTYSTGSMTAAGTTLTVTEAPFVSGDVGKTVTVSGAGVAGAPLVAAITVYTNSSTVTLGTAATYTVSAATVCVTSRRVDVYGGGNGSTPGISIESDGAMMQQPLRFRDSASAFLGGLVPDTTNGYIDLYGEKNGGTRAARVVTDGITLTGTDAKMCAGSGTPEGSKSAAVGSFYLRTDGSAGTSMYVKESGSGNTGWTALTSGYPAAVTAVSFSKDIATGDISDTSIHTTDSGNRMYQISWYSRCTTAGAGAGGTFQIKWTEGGTARTFAAGNILTGSTDTRSHYTFPIYVDGGTTIYYNSTGTAGTGVIAGKISLTRMEA